MKGVLPLLLLVTACGVVDDRPNQWDAFIYPNAEASDKFEVIRGFKSFELCQEAAIGQMRQLSEPDKASYECGYKCEYDPRVEVDVCKETRD